MESANWRAYRGHHIIARKSLLGRRRYDVWKDGRLVGTYRGIVAAEGHIDSQAESS